MNQNIKNIFIALLIIVIVASSVWVMLAYNLVTYKLFAPAYENVNRQVFENTYSYKRGMIQELQNMQFEYQKAEPSQKAALASIILHRSAGSPPEEMPNDLRLFIQNLK